MSQSLHPDDGVDGDSGHKAAQKREKIPHWTRPFSVLRYAIEQAEKSEDEYDEHGRRKTPAYGQLVVFALLVVALLALLRWFNYLDNNSTVAIFTIVLAALGIVQFMSSVYMFLAMRDQNRIMDRQMGQTDEIINAMRIEQKAWLSIESILIRELHDDRENQCIIKFSNTGETPGKIVKITVRAYTRESRKDYNAIRDEFDAIGFEMDYVYLVIPGAPVNLHFPLPKVETKKIVQIIEGTMEYHILCRVQYMDISNGLSEIKGFYTWIPHAQSVWTHEGYCAFP